LSLRNWDNIFQAAYGAEDPKADNLIQIARQTGATPGEIVHVGDQLDDQRGAKQSGCRFIAMLADRAASSITDEALFIEDLRQLPPLLKRIFGEAL
jgi:phosphoglycolate phosphatase-like HAD superfamily hydrolase